jgi:GR25 family glycosyltransferase involved in LPS biosynthesis
MKNLTDWFSRVYIISCQHTPGRLQAALDHLAATGLADLGGVKVHRGVIGAWTGQPNDWLAGAGAWGCHASHRRLLEDVMHERNEDMSFSLESILILEDDVFFVDGALEKLNQFMESVPADWDQIYLGGEHKAPSEKVNPKVCRGKSVNRTHAHAIHSRNYQNFYRHITLASDFIQTRKHIDHQLEVAHQRKDWNVYCPHEWIAGQRENLSIITGLPTPQKIWQR